MSLDLVLVAQRQSPKGMCLSWGAMEDVSAYSVFVAARKLSPEELEAASLLGGTEECIVAKIGGELTSVIDDVTPQSETRFYGVAMSFVDGTVRATRFKALADGGQPESFVLSASKGAKAAAARPRTAAPASAPAETSAQPTRPPADFPLDDRLEARMTGATQSWDGLRIHWQRVSGVAAFEVIASDHQVFAEELGDVLAGRADFTTAVAVGPGVTCLIDNVTAREARGWYLVLARDRDGRRSAHPFEVADAATSGRADGPFLNPNRTGEVRAEADDLIDRAREQWERWQAEQDGGARREARRMVQDAQLIYPGYPAAKALADEMA